jgi:predicted RNA binding protein YcfA (HicA-like mRNA interferase family)
MSAQRQKSPSVRRLTTAKLHTSQHCRPENWHRLNQAILHDRSQASRSRRNSSLSRRKCAQKLGLLASVATRPTDEPATANTVRTAMDENPWRILIQLNKPTLDSKLSTHCVNPSNPVVSGRDVVKPLGHVGFIQVSQRGSHATLRHADRAVIVPLHREIAPGSLRSIF